MEWHNVIDPHSPLLDELAIRYHLHPLHIEDCRTQLQGAKIEDGESYIFTVVKSVCLDADNELRIYDVDLFLGKDYVITVLEKEDEHGQQRLERVRSNVPNEQRSDQLYYRVIDATVDTYLPVLDKYDDVIDDLEDEALDVASPSTLSTIFSTKRNLIYLRRILVNTRDVASHLQRVDSPYIARDLWPFLRDVYDHVARNLDQVETLRDLLSGTLDVYLSSVANRTNQVMKVLTVLSTIALPALVVSGIYGMNVKGLPWSEHEHGLLFVMIIMVSSTSVLLWALKRWRWL
jgi:magnesium transporter